MVDLLAKSSIFSKEAVEAIEGVVKNQFTCNSIVEVKIKVEKDFENDVVIHILITINDLFSDKDRKKMVGLIRHIKSELSSFIENEDEYYFPMVNFISDKDAIERNREFT